MFKKFTVVILGTLLSASLTFGSGFSIYEQGGKATAMGGAFIGLANDASAVFYNPAGITNLEGTNISLGTAIIIPAFAFQGPTSVDKNLYTKANDLVFPPTHFYATHQLTDNLTAGFGFYTLFGLGSEWDKNWAGRELATETHFQTFFLNPVIAYKIMDNLSIAAGYSLVIATVSMGHSNYVQPTDTYVESKLEGSTTGHGFNAGLQFKPMKGLSLGAVYRHNVQLDFEDGDATFDIPASLNPAVDAIHAGLFPDTKGSAGIKLANLIGAGLAYDLTDDFTATFDFMQLGWSSYDELTIKFDDPVAGKDETVAEKGYEDSYSLRFGLEYRYTESLAFRAGYCRDNHAVPDENVEPDLPEGDRNCYTVGIGYKMSDFIIDAWYFYLSQDERKITDSNHEFNGTYTGMGNLFGVTLGYSF